MHRIDGAGHVGNLFVTEDPAINRPPTEVTADILNALQEEICEVIEYFGFVLNKLDNTQLRQVLENIFAPIISPQFQGNPTAPTPGQFDNDTSLSTTAFVQRALGNLSGFSTVNASANLIASQAGRLIQIGNSIPSGQTVTLPAISTLVHGACYWIYNSGGTNAITIACEGLDTLISGGSSLILQPKEFAIFDAQLPNLWNVLGTISAIQMPASLAANGYQKLPSGLLECRGTFTASATPGAAQSVTFPLGFTTVHELVITPVNASATTSSAWFDSLTGSGFNGRCNIASLVCHYIAKGVL